MLVVTGLIEVAEADIEAARAAAAEMAVATRREAGCIAYAFYEDVEAPGRFRVYEEWDDQDALTAHGETPHMATFRAALAGFDLRSAKVQKFTAGPKSDL